LAAERRLVLPDLRATRALGRRLAGVLRKGDLVALEGELGAGKSELARAAIRARAGAEIEVPSPTFTLVQAYDLPGLRLTHADLYRLAAAEEVLELGLDEAVSQGALLVEWPERAGGLLPGMRLTIRLAIPDPADPDRREALLVADAGWADRLEALAP
jgi:tRNA threonylcarbamoyl adenosine modification protein YjeE